ncbi:unnamed protein product [Adineta steineri]|uniref:Uncharacterized protein n=1 Tax=Adineta steineri TaxID=433720 RepID=A0A819MF54_9BILA|nr:unnamed protein product [Adineta steineri]
MKSNKVNVYNDVPPVNADPMQPSTVVNGQQPVVCRLDGEQWVRYLNYTHDPNRIWTEKTRFSSFCCRRSTYERLMNRQYGHIILHENVLIIDELYFISFREYTLQKQILSIAVTYISSRVYGVTGLGLSLGIVHLL